MEKWGWNRIVCMWMIVRWHRWCVRKCVMHFIFLINWYLFSSRLQEQIQPVQKIQKHGISYEMIIWWVQKWKTGIRQIVMMNQARAWTHVYQTVDKTFDLHGFVFPVFFKASLVSTKWVSAWVCTCIILHVMSQTSRFVSFPKCWEGYKVFGECHTKAQPVIKKWQGR